MKVVSLLAQKGGCGKSTLTLHFAVEHELRTKERVAVIDLDPQESAVQWSERRGKDTPELLRAKEQNLGKAVEACEAEGVDLVLIDTMPRSESSIAEAARVSDVAVIPCGPSVLDIEAISRTVEVIKRVGAQGVIVLNLGRPGPGTNGASVNEQVMHVLAQYGLPICPRVVMRRVALAEAFNDGRAVMELDPDGKGSKEIAESWSWIRQQL